MAGYVLLKRWYLSYRHLSLPGLCEMYGLFPQTIFLYLPLIEDIVSINIVDDLKSSFLYLLQ